MSSSFAGSRLRALLTAGAIAASTLTIAAAPAHAGIAGQTTTTSTASKQLSNKQRWHDKAQKVINAASSRRGVPYVYGAAGPHRFDCSGLVLWTYARALGMSLPHSAQMQMQRSKIIHDRSRLRPGDLIFEVTSSGYAYHVGIFAGHHQWWVAPHTGTNVQLQHLYPSRKRFGRLIRAHH